MTQEIKNMLVQYIILMTWVRDNAIEGNNNEDPDALYNQINKVRATIDKTEVINP